jgi:hypothetical protein
MVSDGPFFFAVFLIFSVFGLLVLPTAVVVPNERVGGITCGGKGVAVAVGVGVGVAVVVGVGVRVEVAVAVRVAVAVGVAV